MRSVRRQVPNRCPTAQQQPWRSAIRWRLAVRQGAGRRGRYGRGGAREGGQLTALGEQTRAGRAWGHGAAGAPPEAPDDAHHMALVRREQLSADRAALGRFYHEQLSADRAALGRFYHGCRSICRWCLRHGVAKESGGAALVEARRSSATTWPWFGASSRRKVRGHGSAGRRATEVRQPRTEVKQPSTEVRQQSTEVRQPSTEVRQPRTKVRQSSNEVNPTKHRGQATTHRGQRTKHRGQATKHRGQATAQRGHANKHRGQATKHRGQSNHASRSGNHAVRSMQPSTEVRQSSIEVKHPITRRHVSRHAAAPDGAHHRMGIVQREQPVEDLETPGVPGAAGALQLSQAALRETPRSSAGRRASHGRSGNARPGRCRGCLATESGGAA